MPALVRTPTDNLRVSATYESKLNSDYDFWTNYITKDYFWNDTEVNDIVLAAKYNWSDTALGGGSNYAALSFEPGFINAFDSSKKQSLIQDGYYGWYALAAADISRSRSQYLFGDFQLLLSANGKVPTEMTF